LSNNSSLIQKKKALIEDFRIEKLMFNLFDLPSTLAIFFQILEIILNKKLLLFKMNKKQPQSEKI